jgi:4-hydroxy-2-oxoheptanedioate aldolase
MTSVAHNRLANLLNEGKVLLGVAHCYAAEGILETIGPGWDFVWIDGQHGQFGFESALRAVRVASALGLETVLRVPTHDPGLLGLYADTGASALMIPLVDTPAMAADVVRALRFPPHGNRSFGGRRVIDVHGRDYYRTREPLVVAQIESASGLKDVEAIAAVEGVHVLFFGADDMKLHLGISMDTPLRESGLLLEAQRATAQAARAAGKWCGCVAMDPRDLRTAVEQGYQLIPAGADVRFLRLGSRQALEDARRVVGQVFNLTSDSTG